MIPIVDIQPRLSISNTAYDETNRYLYKASNLYVLIREISFFFDSNFLTNGRIQVSLKDKSITSQAGELTEVQPIASFTIRFESDDLFILAPGESIETKFRVITASGIVQTQLTIILLNEDEYKKLIEKKGLI